MEKEILLNVDIDVKDAEQAIINLKKEVEDLKIKQSSIAKEIDGELNPAYIRATSEVKAAQAQLNATQRVYDKLTSAQRENAGTIEQLEAENAKLRAEQRKLNLTTTEGIEKNERIIKKINENTEAIKKHSDATTKGRMEVGQYAKGFTNLVDQAKAFIATPLGATLAVLTGLFLTLKKALTSTEEGQNKLNKLTNLLSGAFNALMKVLQPVASFLVDVLIVSFEKLSSVAGKAIGIVSKGLKAIGLDSAAKALDKFNNELDQTTKAANELSDAEAKLQKQQREANKTMLDYQKQAEKLRQLRDDETKTIPERIKANEKLGALLKEQMQAELTIANQALLVANLRIQKEGETTEALDQRAQALEKISDIQERITGQESEQLANLNSLRREAAAIEKGLSDKKKAEQEKALKESEESRKKALDDALKSAQIELQIWQMQNQSKIDGSKRLTDELVNEETKRLEENKKRQLEDLELEQLSEREKYLAKLQIEEEFLINSRTLNENYTIQKLNDEITAQQERYSLLNEGSAAQFDAQVEMLQKEKERELAIENLTAEQKILIEKRYAKAVTDVEKAKTQAQLNFAKEFLGNVASAFGEGSKIAKVAASAQTVINTVQGAQAAFAAAQVIPPPFGQIFGGINAGLVVASGAKAVKDIWSQKTGLPGDGGGGGGSVPSAPSASSAVSQIPQQTSINAEIGRGIVGRTDQTNQQSQVVLQPTLVVDDVTSKQIQQTNISNTQIL